LVEFTGIESEHCIPLPFKPVVSHSIANQSVRCKVMLTVNFYNEALLVDDEVGHIPTN
jgi:hypothetical protein